MPLLKAEEAKPSPQTQGPVSCPDDQARFLAGLDVPNNSLLYSRSKNSNYSQHVADFKRNWQNYESSYFSKQRAWSDSQVRSHIPPPRVVYYPFSGPDFVNAYAYFPNADTYILIGRELIGTVTPPEKLSDAEIDHGLDNLRNTTSSILRFSFFITKEMQASMGRSEFRGVLPVLYTFIALTGHHITDVKQVTAGGSPAVRIQFNRGGTNQTLYYVQGNLSDGSSNALISWLQSFPPGAGYVKSCSYLLHESSFSKIRQFLLQHCDAILQDDSGIPYRYFPSNEWTVYLFGSYTHPISIFASKYQSDLQRAYNAPGAAHHLPFGTGYNWRPGQSNLMLAVKRGR